MIPKKLIFHKNIKTIKWRYKQRYADSKIYNFNYTCIKIAIQALTIRGNSKELEIKFIRYLVMTK